MIRTTPLDAAADVQTDENQVVFSAKFGPLVNQYQFHMERFNTSTCKNEAFSSTPLIISGDVFNVCFAHFPDRPSLIYIPEKYREDEEWLRDIMATFMFSIEERKERIHGLNKKSWPLDEDHSYLFANFQYTSTNLISKKMFTLNKFDYPSTTYSVLDCEGIRILVAEYKNV
jgi:hypothetical protein